MRHGVLLTTGMVFLATAAQAAGPQPLELACTFVSPQFRTELHSQPAALAQGSMRMEWHPAMVEGTAPDRSYTAAQLVATFSISGAHRFDRVSPIFNSALNAREIDSPSLFRDGAQKLDYSDTSNHSAADIAASVTPQGVYVSGISSVALFHPAGSSIRYAASLYTEQPSGDGFVDVSGQCQMQLLQP